MSSGAMKWSSAISLEANTDEALAEASAIARQKLGPGAPDVVFVFVSPHHRNHFSEITGAVQKLGTRHILGCSAGGVIGAAMEAEQVAALSITAAILPGVEITPFRLEDAKMPDADSSPRVWEPLTGVKIPRDEKEPQPAFVMLADPFSINPESIVNGLDFAYPDAVKIGGLASSASGPGQNALYLDGHMFREGAVGLALSGNVAVDTLVAQGCRPIGQPMSVTKCNRNILIELDKRRALEVLHELYHSSNERDQELIRTKLNLGLVMHPSLDSTAKPGDFLIRNLLGMDAERGALAVGAILREGQVVQFHLRDALSASEDLEAVLRRYSTAQLNGAGGESVPAPPRGALLFSCLGRGIGLYNRPHHDSHAFTSQLGDVPLGGFFCNGEIGPVQKTTYVHGFTSCFGIFRAKS